MSTLVGKRILVVEDEALVAAMVEDMLAEVGATVVGPAMSIAEGLALAVQEGIDAAVLDVNVRGEPIDAVADLLRTRGIPIVFATGYGEGTATVTRDDPVLDKPYGQDALTRAVTGVLHRG